MFGSQIENKNVLVNLYKDKRTVFRLIDIAILLGDTSMQLLSKKLNYYVRKGQLQNPRKGIYANPGYDPEELACRLFTPSYISLEYVLQKSGIIFQYDSQITSISYLSRSIEVESKSYRFRKMKGSILSHIIGINRLPNHVNIASPERAFLDMFYLSPDFYFDNLNPLDKEHLNKLLPLYQSKALTQRVTKLLQHD